MLLDLAKIKEITSGAVEIEETKNGVEFFRFNKEQTEFYKEHDERLYPKTFANAGVKLCFDTDGTALNIGYSVTPASSRRFYAIDLFVNGDYVGSADNFTDVNFPEDYVHFNFDLSDKEKTFVLGGGKKRVELYFPWSMAVTLKSLSLKNATFVTGVKSDKKLLVFGDSITQGYDSFHPYNRYTCALSSALNMQEVNKAIGAECFVPELANLKENFTPDLMSVAYGTNDWSKTEKEVFTERAYKFYENLRKNYKEVQILALCPIWRADSLLPKMGYAFTEVKKTIEKIAEKIDGITVIDCFDFVPQDKNLFSDKYLHPTDSGFKFYSDRLIKKFCI